MTPESCIETGKCAMHDDEVEQRVNQGKAIKDLIKQLKRISLQLAGITAIGGLLLLVITGNFVYTKDVGNRSERLNDMQAEKIDHHIEVSQVEMHQMMGTVVTLAKSVAVANKGYGKDIEHLKESTRKLEDYLNRGGGP